MKLNKSKRRHAESQQFLLGKKQEIELLLGQIDCPQEINTPVLSVAANLSFQPLPPDSLTLLLAKAKHATERIPLKKRFKKKVVPVDHNAFLTDVDAEKQKQQSERQEEREALDQEVIKLLQKQPMQDELKLLRRQIKQAGGHLKSYEKQTLATKKSVGLLAGRYNSYFNLKVPLNHPPTLDFSKYTQGMRSLRQLKTGE